MVKAVKLADIAEKVGVSVVTVSKALSGQKGVSEEMRARIKELADEMGYTPIHASQAGRTRSYTIGVVTFETYFTRFASFYWKMYQELATRAVKKNCFSMLEVISNYDEENLVWPKLITENQKIDGIIVIGRPKLSYLKMLYQNKKIPMAFMDFYDDEEVVDSVVSASFNGMYRMTDYLIKNGHTKIAFVGTVMYTESITDRYFGYCKALMEAGISPVPEWVLDDRNQEGYMVDICLPERMPTAFACNSDLTASALVKTLEARGYRIPEDISVVGFDNYLYDGLCNIKITSYEVNVEEMVRAALKDIVRQIQHGRELPDSLRQNVQIISGRLVVKDSVKVIR